jgi:hypothetical protein
MAQPDPVVVQNVRFAEAVQSFGLGADDALNSGSDG